MSSIPTTEYRNGELNGPRPAKCKVTINRTESVVTFTINEVEPRAPPDGRYTLTVNGEPASRWKRDKNGWTRLS